MDNQQTPTQCVTVLVLHPARYPFKLTRMELEENVPVPTKQWFVLRVSYGRILDAKELIDYRNIACYVPMQVMI